MLSCLILLRHHDNIQRLWRRQEQNLDPREEEKRQSRSNLLPAPPAGELYAIAPFIPPYASLAIKAIIATFLLL